MSQPPPSAARPPTASSQKWLPVITMQNTVATG